MKKIAIFLFLFVAVCFAIWAQNKRTSDYPNTAVPNTSDLLLIARPGSPGTNLNMTFAQLYSVVTTNVLSVSNASAITYFDDTNSLVVYSVGDVASRGTYYFKDTLNAIHRYTNSLGNGKFVGYDPNDVDFGLDAKFAITNGAGVLLYGSAGQSLSQPKLLPQVFSHFTGTAPDGIITWGTNPVTTFQPQVTTSLSLPIRKGGNIWFVRTNGNDDFAVRGREDLPGATLYRMATNAVAGDIIDIGPGTFSVTNWGTDASQYKEFEFPPNLTIRGSGKQITFIVGRQSSSIWHLSNSNVVQSFTATNLWFYDRVLGIATNILIKDVEDSASGDVVVFNTGSWFPLIEGCDFSGNSDKIAEFDANPGYFANNNVITVVNTRISGGGATDSYGIRMAQSGPKSVWKMYGVHVDTGIVADRSTILAGYVGMIIQSNLVSTWPTVPRTKGDAFWGNSNGVIYLLTSTPSGTAWGATNKIAP